MPKDLNGHLIPGVRSPERQVPPRITRPEYVGKKKPAAYTGSDVYTPEDIERIRRAGRIAADAIALVGENVRPGVTTDQLD
jgi:methionyl aminopeptidase